LKRNLFALKPQQKQKRNRLIALSFVSVLLLLIYGPLAQWFVAADRVLYDTLASGLPNEPLDNAVIVSIDPSRTGQDSLIDTYGQIIAVLNASRVKRIIMTQPPEITENDNLPGWAVAMNANVPVYAQRVTDLQIWPIVMDSSTFGLTATAYCVVRSCGNSTTESCLLPCLLRLPLTTKA